MKNKTNKIYTLNIGKNIRLWREFMELKQEDLAKQINISKSTLSKIENGINIVNVHLMEDVAEALKIEVTKLFLNPHELINTNDILNSNTSIKMQQSQTDKDLIKSMLERMDKKDDQMHFFMKEIISSITTQFKK